jgi:hypothetical protein
LLLAEVDREEECADRFQRIWDWEVHIVEESQEVLDISIRSVFKDWEAVNSLEDNDYRDSYLLYNYYC